MLERAYLILIDVLKSNRILYVLKPNFIITTRVQFRIKRQKMKQHVKGRAAEA